MAKIALLLILAALVPSPGRGEDWEKIADVEAQAGRPGKAAEALSKAIALRPDDAALLKKHAALASWAGDSAAAERSYRALVRLNPEDYDSRYQLANVISWQGRTKEAIGVVNDCLDRRPKDAKALLFLSQLHLWSGDMAASREALERYKALVGVDKDYRSAMARLLAGSGKDSAAIAAADAALRESPDDCDLYTIKAEAESSARRWSGMFESLTRAGSGCADKAAVAALSRRLSTPLRSSVHGVFSYAKDNIGVEIGAYALDGRYRIDPATYLSMGAESGWLRARVGSGLETARGDARVDLRGGWVGGERAVGDRLWLSGRVGHRTADEGDSALIAKAGAEYRAADSLVLRNDLGHDLYAVSPRAVSNNIRLIDDTLHAAWRFARRGTLYVDAGYGSFSDGNFLWTATVAPRWTALSGRSLSVDLGVSGKVSSFNNPLNGSAGGYYAPNRFRQFQANVLASYAFSADDAINASMNLGAVRDENQPRYGFGYDYSVEGVFGLYRAWMLRLRVDFIDSLGRSGGASGDYHLQQYSVSLMRRF